MTTLKLLRAFALISASRWDGPSRPILQGCANTVAVGLDVLVESLIGDGSFLYNPSCRRLRIVRREMTP